MTKLLLVEDEGAVRDMLRFALDGDGFQLVEAAGAGEALACIRQSPPDLILLDWMLPGMSGIEFARRLRREAAHRDIPIIMLTARGAEDDKVQGLDAGVDDYITKPFSTRELRARIHAVIRRSGRPGAARELIEVNGLALDSAGHQVHASGAALKLGPTEFRLLRFFMMHPERVYSRAQLLDHVWGTGVYVEDRTVDVHIRRLRKALAPHGYDGYIQTVRSVGYRFSAQVTA